MQFSNGSQQKMEFNTDFKSKEDVESNNNSVMTFAERKRMESVKKDLKNSMTREFNPVRSLKKIDSQT